MRSVIALAKLLAAFAALALLASCAETPSTPTTSGGSSSGSGKIVTATPDETLECDGDLILEPHLPEECIPPEPPESVKPVEPPKPDPIVGTYRLFPITSVNAPPRRSTSTQHVYRFFPNDTAGANGWNDEFRWRREGDVYKVYRNSSGKEYSVATLKYQWIKGEPQLITVESVDHSYHFPAEGLKLSSDPTQQLDFYKVTCRYSTKSKCLEPKRSASGEHVIKDTGRWKILLYEPLPGWHCENVGRMNYLGYRGLLNIEFIHGHAPDWGNTLAECESRCEQALLNQFETVGEGNCSDYQG